jgi:hypothetical protein
VSAAVREPSPGPLTSPSKLAAIEARTASWNRQSALIDEIRTGLYVAHAGDRVTFANLTKVEIALHWLEEDVKELLKRKQ